MVRMMTVIVKAIIVTREHVLSCFRILGIKSKSICTKKDEMLGWREKENTIPGGGIANIFQNDVDRMALELSPAYKKIEEKCSHKEYILILPLYVA